MSIYATSLHLDGDGEHHDSCAAWKEDEPGSRVFVRTDEPYCPERFEQPLIYQGSHVLPSDDDPRGGMVSTAWIPSHITREGRDDAPEGELKDWLRLTVAQDPSTYRPQSNFVDVVLTRLLVEQLRDELSSWLDAEQRW